MIGTDVLRLQKNKLYQAKRGNKQGIVDSTSDLSHTLSALSKIE